MNVQRLHKILAETTVQLRKGEVVVCSEAGPVAVTEIYDMPAVSEAPSGLDMVDMEFLVIGVDRAKAEAARTEVVGLLNDWPDDSLAGGPSYITVGGAIGDQGAAFCLFALGQTLGLWKVITPATFGMTGEEARTAAGSGFIMISGYTASKVAA